MQRWESLIDEACKACGSQNKLATRLGITGPNMSQARHGQRRLTTDQVAQMAEILGVPAADVWLAQEDYRNPFRVVETAAVAILAALFLFTLPSESQAMARVSSDCSAKGPTGSLYTLWFVQGCLDGEGLPMKIQLHSIHHAPANLPYWQTLMDDLCNPAPEQVAKVIGKSARTIHRYNATGCAPRVVCLAVFWLTSWGRNAVHTQAHNDAVSMAGLAHALRCERDTIQAESCRLNAKCDRLKRVIQRLRNELRAEIEHSARSGGQR